MTNEATDFLEVLGQHAVRLSDRPVFRLATDESDLVLTYAGLAERVARLGGALTSRGIGPGIRVGLCMENRPAWPVAYLSIWYAGATVVPIDPALEAHAIERILEHAGVPLVLTSRQLGSKILRASSALAAAPEILDADAAGDYYWDGDAPPGFPAPEGTPCGRGWSDFIAAEAPPFAPVIERASPATIMYTSGTTGLPKGVMLSRGALFDNVADGLERIRLDETDHVLGVLPLFHSLPLMTNFLAPLVAGGQVTFLVELNPDRIIAAFPRFGITLFACVPLFFYRFHDRVMKGIADMPGVRRRIARVLLRLNRPLRRTVGLNIGPRAFAAAHRPFGPELRTFLSGGARFDPEVHQDFLDLGFTVLQGYGLTEACAGLTAHPRDELASDTVGRPLRRVRVRIAEPNEHGIGEIVATGPNLMAGYFGNPDATRAVVREGWLHTGDLGRLLPNGHLQITGRAKDMIVLASGKNIYPEELESYYGKSEFISEICILGIPDPRRRGAERLHALVVPDLEAARRSGHANIREMVTWDIEGLGLSLPGPQRLTSLEIRRDPLPRTTTRKLKRFELKAEIVARAAAGEEAPDAQVSADAPEDTGPEAPWVHRARSVIAEHARVEGVSRSQHLDIDLGLESLDRVELQAALEGALAIRLPDASAAEVQTVGDLLDLLAAHVDPDAEPENRADAWKRLLAETPPEIEPYLRQRRLSPALGFALGRLVRLVQTAVGFRVAGTEHLPAEYPFILAPNHLSYVDPFLLGVALPWRVFARVFFVGYSAYFRGFVREQIGRLLRTVPIDQNRNLEAAMQAAAAGLRRQMVLGIFPEGARSGDGRIKDFRRGAGILARELAAPVVPVGIWGTFEMWPREGKFRPHPVAIVFGPPLAPADGESDADFVLRLRKVVSGLHIAARRLSQGS